MADDNAEVIKKKQWYLDQVTEGVNNLLTFHLNATMNGEDYEAEVKSSLSTKAAVLCTSNWGVLIAAEAKVIKDAFEGNVVSLGILDLSLSGNEKPQSEVKRLQQLNKMFYPIAGGPTTFKFLPLEGKVWIEGWLTLDELAVPEDIDSKHQCFIMVAKDGNAMDLTIGQYTGLVSFTENNVGHFH
ncbi:hypothetical protein F5148DRAFT_1293406 [Russula earlei]|uniref:Uncharacterized protein n=1 Tax=Russula earlei TaxID=71964 RepID=A0ACC0TTV7_9AGAM|nr:hypothetical protein F5148DRAFT_1293406 [Russula earlei]